MSSDGTSVPLRPQTAEVLKMLAAAPGELVTKDRLMSTIWADTHVTDDSLVQCISEIRRALGPEDGQALKTIPRQGYRLDVAPAEDRAGGVPRGRLFAGLLAALVLIAAVWLVWRPAAPPPERSLAVLPLANLSQDDSYRYFANGLSEDLVISLSKLPDLRVVSRASAAAAAGDSDDPRAVAQALGVAYVVDGTVRRRGESLRMTAALIDGATGRNVWAESYEGSLDDVFAFQDAVLDQIVRVLAVRLSPAERDRLGIKGTGSALAYDQYLRGMELENFLTPSANRDSEAAFREAIRLDPGYASAHAYLSLVLSNSAEYGWADDERAAIADAIWHGDQAVALDPDLPFAFFARGRLRSRRFVGDIEGSLADFRRAIDIDPDYQDAYAFMANVLVFDGRAAEGREMIESALSKSPAPPYWYYVPLGISNYYLGDYEAAEAALLTVVERNPNSPHAMRNLMATYGRLGRLDDAEWYMFEYEALGHVATVSEILSRSGKQHEAYREAFAEGLRLAGLPE